MILQCPRCDSRDIGRWGQTLKGTLRFACKRCGKTFIDPAEKEKILKKQIAHKVANKKFLETLVAFYGPSSILKVYY